MKTVTIGLILLIVLLAGIYVYKSRSVGAQGGPLTETTTVTTTTTVSEDAKGGPVKYGECGDGVCDYGENTPSYPYYCPGDC